MNGHDPLCPWAFMATSCIMCDVITRVREDERRAVFEDTVIHCGEYGRALRDAVEVVKAHRISGYFCSCGAEVNSQAGHHVAAIESLGGER